MQTFRPLSLILCLCLTTGMAQLCRAEVYKHVDKDGNITYTDVPSKAKEQPIKVKPMTPISAPPIKSGSTQTKTETKKPTQYRSLIIQQPTSNEVIRANSGSVPVALQSQPGLDAAAGHKYAILLDGKLLQSGQSPSLTINEVARGSHTISAQILDAKDTVLITATPVSVQVLRASAISPVRKR